jgi:hypothetical protein
MRRGTRLMSDHDHDDSVEAYEPPAVIDRVRIDAALSITVSTTPT